MPDDTPSIEELIGSDVGSGQGDETARSKLVAKEEEIKRKDIERLTKQQAGTAGLFYINLFGFAISPDALALIKEEEARRLKAICFYYDGINLRLATTRAQAPEVKELLKKLSARYYAQGQLYLISGYSLNYALKLYATLPEVRQPLKAVEISGRDLARYSEKFSSFKDLQAQIDQTRQATDMVTMIMAAAIKINGSDIHIEKEEKDIKVRFRVDGVLHDAAVLNDENWHKIISRLKLLAGVKINVTDKPQDGRITIHSANERVDIRASFLPTAYGESVAMRLLLSSAVSLEFEKLGLNKRAFEQLKREIERPNGMIITTGPTGSGKTTTQYAILKKINNSETKIITIEDPIEYQLAGVNQSQISQNYTFAKGLKSIVRQDPDVIMVGEIRDLETAEIAIQASLTGHLVLSTIHTNDAAGTVPRFLSMGVKPFLLAPSLNVMIGQRLVRRVCEQCKKEIQPDQATLIRVKDILDKLPEQEKQEIDFNQLNFYQGAGCQACQEIGYKGRIGIFEIMPMDNEVEKLILSGQVSEYDMRENAKKKGMINMVQDGLLKALKGLTSVAEIFRVAEEK